MALMRILFSLVLCLIAPVQHAADLDDVYARPGPHVFNTQLEVWRDETRDRTLPVKLYLPLGRGPFPVIVFSHGLGGTRESGRAWAEQWASHGFIAIHLQHPGSDAEIWMGYAPGERVAQLKRAMSPQELAARVRDMHFAVDEILRRHGAAQEPFDRADTTRIGAAGQAFGAIVVQALAGERLPSGLVGYADMRDSRLKAFVAFSPSARGSDEGLTERFANMRLPFLSITGTLDGLQVVDGAKPDNRWVPFQHMPAPDKYLLSIQGADHVAFNARSLPVPEDGPVSDKPIVLPRNPQLDARVVQLASAASTAFWLSYLGSAEQAGRAHAYLRDGGFKRTLGVAGVWQIK
jgi:predicted dienelactone hydrolase